MGIQPHVLISAEAVLGFAGLAQLADLIADCSLFVSVMKWAAS